MIRSFSDWTDACGAIDEASPRGEIAIASCQLADAEIAAAVEVLKGGNLARGPAVADFEHEFALRMGGGHAVACASGTAALHLVYSLLLQPGDEVLVPAMTFLSTASMLLAVGCVPIFCDVDEESWLIDLDDAKCKLTPRTRAIVPVHIFGNPCDPVAIERFAVAHGLQVIFDAAQAHGASYAGRRVGDFGPVTIFSLYATKNLFAGEGGMVCCADEGMATELRHRRNHGIAEDGYARNLGFNYRLPQVLAAIGNAQLGRLDAMITRRRENAAALTQGLRGLPGVRFQYVAPQAGHALHHFCIVVDELKFGLGRDGLADALRIRGIGTAVHYRFPPHRQPLFGGNGMSAPRTDAVCAAILALPVHHDLTRDDAAMIVEAIWDIHRAGAARSRSV